jgi:hypothetical protein
MRAPLLVFPAIVSVGLTWASMLPGSAKVFTYSELDCRCEVPDTWIFQDKPGDLIDVVDSAHQKSFLLRAVRVNRSVTLANKGFITSLEQGFITRGFTITDRKMTPLHGVTFYQIDLTKDMGNKSIYDCAYVALANGYGYLMECSSYQAAPEDDDELKSIIASFEFIDPPQIHTSSWTNIFTPRDGLEHDATYLAGYRLGVILMLLAMLSCPILMLVAIGVGIYFIVRKNAAPPPHYPGAPPNFPPQ